MAKVFNFVKKVGPTFIEIVKEDPLNTLGPLIFAGVAASGLIYGANSNRLAKRYEEAASMLMSENTMLKCKIEETGNRFYDHLVSTGCTDKEALDKLNGIKFHLD